MDLNNLNASNINSGVLAVAYGGTGFTSASSSAFFCASSALSLASFCFASASSFALFASCISTTAQAMTLKLSQIVANGIFSS